MRACGGMMLPLLICFFFFSCLVVLACDGDDDASWVLFYCCKYAWLGFLTCWIANITVEYDKPFLLDYYVDTS